MVAFINLPPEILLKIISLLELHDVARTRQACRQLQMVTQDKSIWDALLASQRSRYPVPPWHNLFSPPRPSLSISQMDLERAVLAIHRVAQAWSKVRPAPFKVQPRQGNMLSMLEMFSDRWLLVVYAEGLAYLWDTFSSSMAPPGSSGTTSRIKVCAKLVDENENRPVRWTSCAAQLSEDGQKLVVLLNTQPDPAPFCRVYEVPLRAETSFKLLVTVRLGEPEVIRTISFTDNVLLLSRGSAINIVDINASPHRDLLVLSPYSDDLEDIWNSVIEIRVFNRYIFVFKARTLEVFNLDSFLSTFDRNVTATPLSQHFFRNTTFREVKVSSPTISIGEQLIIRFQAWSDQPPCFDVTLPNIYPLTSHIVSQYTGPFPDSLTPSPTPTNEAGHSSRQSTNPSSRGFVSAYAVGSQGRRAVWVERVRGSTMREIHVWSCPGMVNDDETPGNEQFLEIERGLVYSIASPDLREDIIRCALSESMGLVVLGNRAGEMFFMDVDA